MTTTVVSSGVTSSGLTVTSGNDLVVFSGGTTSNTVVSSGGTEIVSSGGTASGTMVSRGGLEIVSSGGITTNTVVSSGGTENVRISGTTSDTVVSSGGTETVFGKTSGTVVSSGGFEAVYYGGTTSNTVVSSGGFEFVSGTTSGTVISSGGSEAVSFFGKTDNTVVRSGGTETVSGTATSTMVSNGGTEIVSSGGTTYSTVVSSGGFEVVSNGGTTSNTVMSNGGTETVSSGGTATFTVVSSGGFEILSSGGTATGTELLSGGSIDLPNFVYSAGGTANFDSTTSTLTITEGSVTSSLVLSGSYAGDFFHTAKDVGTGTLITESTVPCFCTGTRIATEHGEIAVEDLRIGDRVRNAFGLLRPIIWIGTRSYSGRFIIGNTEVLPIRIQAEAIAPGLPARDLYLSPRHALFIDRLLIAARDLVNGRSIVQLGQVDRVDYFHIELATHDVLLAESLPAESFLDDGSRGMFHNAASWRSEHPDAVRRVRRYCAPRVEDGFALEAVRQRIARRAGVPMATQTTSRPGKLRGFVERLFPRAVQGWAQDGRHPNAPVCLSLMLGGEVLAETLANLPRADLAKAGIGHGRHGFAFRLARPIAAADLPRLRVVRTADGARLPRLPQASRLVA